MRLANNVGFVDFAGRVEVLVGKISNQQTDLLHHVSYVLYVDGRWGGVCHHNWDIQDANVVCRQLGFRKALAAVKNAVFDYGGAANISLFVSSVTCNGNESSIQVSSCTCNLYDFVLINDWKMFRSVSIGV